MNHEQQTGARSIGDENLPAAAQLDGERVNEPRSELQDRQAGKPAEPTPEKPRPKDNRVIIAASVAAGTIGTVGLVGMGLGIDAAVKASDAADQRAGIESKLQGQFDEHNNTNLGSEENYREWRAIENFQTFLRRVMEEPKGYVDDIYHYISEDMFTDKGFDMLAKLDEANLWALHYWMNTYNRDYYHLPLQGLLEKLTCSEKGLDNLAAWMSKSEDNVLPWLGELFYQPAGPNHTYAWISLCMDYNNDLSYDKWDPTKEYEYERTLRTAPPEHDDDEIYTSESLMHFLMKFYRTEDGSARNGAPDLMKRLLGSKGLNILSRKARGNCEDAFDYIGSGSRYVDWDTEELCDMITFDKEDGELTNDELLNGETEAPEGAADDYVLAQGFRRLERTAALHSIWIALQQKHKDETRHYVEIKEQVRHLVTEDSTGIDDSTTRRKIIDKIQGIITSAWEERVKDVRAENRDEIKAAENLTSNGTNISKAYLQSILSVYYDHEELGISKGQALDVVKSLFGATEHDEVSLFGDRTDGEVLEDCQDLFLDEDVFLHKVTTTADDGTKKEVTKHVCDYLLPNGAPDYPWTKYDDGSLEVQEDYGLDGAGYFNWDKMLAGIKSIAESNDWMPNA